MSRQLVLIAEPRHRATDGHTSKAAAKSIAPVSGYLEAQIVKVAHNGPFTAQQIASILEVREPGRWDEGTIRTAVSRCAKRGLLTPDGTGLTTRGREAIAWRSSL
jgi:hypothetical protein